MKKIVLRSLVSLVFVALFFATVPQAKAYSLPNNGVSFGCLWRDVSCQASSVREDLPTPNEMPRFYLDVIEASTNAGYNGGVCALQASKAVIAAETYTTCMVESLGDANGCKTATDSRANQVTVAQAAPVDPNAPPSVPMQTLQPTPLATGGVVCTSLNNTRSVTVATAKDCPAGTFPPTPNCPAGTEVNEARTGCTAPPVSNNTNPQNPNQGNNGNIGYTPLEPIPGLAEAQSGNTNFALFLKYVFGVLISLGGLSAVVMLIFGGITYMVSDVVHKKTDALRRVQAAMWGLLLLIASWLILNAINPRLLEFELFINPVSNLSGNTSANTFTPSTNNATTLNLSNTDPNRDAALNTFCGRSGSITNRAPAADGLSTNYTCTPYVNNGSVMYP